MKIAIMRDGDIGIMIKEIFCECGEEISEDQKERVGVCEGCR